MFQQYDSLVADTYSACGKLALDMDLLPLAFQFLSKALDRNPIHIVTLLLLCDGYKKDTATVAQNHTRVVELLVNSINSNSEIARDYRIWKELALSYAKLNIPHDALNSISQALTMEPARDSSLWVIQSRILLLLISVTQQQPFETLLAYFNKAVEVSTTQQDVHMQVEAHICLAQLYHRYGDFNEAFNELTNSLNLLNSILYRESYSRARFDKLTYIYKFIATLEFKSNRSIQAKRVCQEALTIVPHTDQIQQMIITLAQLCYFDANPAAGIKTLTDEINLSLPDHHPFMLDYLLGRFYSKLDDSQKSYEHYQIALQHNQKSPLPWISVGAVYLKTGQLHDSLTAYSQAVSLALQEDLSMAPYTIKFYRLFAAFAWFGISQVYGETHQVQDSVNAYRQSSALFRSENDLLNAQEMEQRCNLLMASPHQKQTLIIPDVPVQLLLDMALHEDQSVFSAEENPKQSQTHLSPPPPPAANVSSNPVFRTSGKVSRTSNASPHDSPLVHTMRVSADTTPTMGNVQPPIPHSQHHSPVLVQQMNMSVQPSAPHSSGFKPSPMAMVAPVSGMAVSGNSYVSVPQHPGSIVPPQQQQQQQPSQQLPPHHHRHHMVAPGRQPMAIMASGSIVRAPPPPPPPPPPPSASLTPHTVMIADEGRHRASISSSASAAPLQQLRPMQIFSAHTPSVIVQPGTYPLAMPPQ